MDGTTISLRTHAVLDFGGKTYDLASPVSTSASTTPLSTTTAAESAKEVFTLQDGITFTAAPTGFEVMGMDVLPGSSGVVEGGVTVSLGLGGVVVVGGRTVTLGAGGGTSATGLGVGGAVANGFGRGGGGVFEGGAGRVAGGRGGGRVGMLVVVVGMWVAVAVGLL